MGKIWHSWGAAQLDWYDSAGWGGQFARNKNEMFEIGRCTIEI